MYRYIASQVVVENLTAVYLLAVDAFAATMCWKRTRFVCTCVIRSFLDIVISIYPDVPDSNTNNNFASNFSFLLPCTLDTSRHSKSAYPLPYCFCMNTTIVRVIKTAKSKSEKYAWFIKFTQVSLKDKALKMN